MRRGSCVTWCGAPPFTGWLQMLSPSFRIVDVRQLAAVRTPSNARIDETEGGMGITFDGCPPSVAITAMLVGSFCVLSLWSA